MFYATYLLVNKLPPCVDMSENEIPSRILALQRFCLQSLLPYINRFLFCFGFMDLVLAIYSVIVTLFMSFLIQFVFPSTGSSVIDPNYKSSLKSVTTLE